MSRDSNSVAQTTHKLLKTLLYTLKIISTHFSMNSITWIKELRQTSKREENKLQLKLSVI